MRITILEICIFCAFIIGMSILWADIYTLRDQIQMLRNENDLMVSEIERNTKMLAEMDLKLYPVKIIPGK